MIIFIVILFFSYYNNILNGLDNEWDEDDDDMALIILFLRLNLSNAMYFSYIIIIYFCGFTEKSNNLV